MSLLAVVFLLPNVVTAAHVGTSGQLRQARGPSGFVEGLGFKHRLRVCNAYPVDAPLDVFRGREQLTAGAPMPYKACRDFVAGLKAGDRLKFEVGGANAGTFAVSDLPNNDAVLLLVIHRHDTSSTAVAFESHVFASLLNAQVAIIDTYRGAQKSKARIVSSSSTESLSLFQRMMGKKGPPPRAEELRFKSVVALNPGQYEVQLEGPQGQRTAQTGLVALNRESYVVLRTGVEPTQGNAYPEELVVFPESDPAKLNGASSVRAGVLGVFLGLLVFLVHA